MSSKDSRPGNLRRFFRYAMPYRKSLALATLVGVLKFNLPVAFPWILKEVVDRVLEGRPSSLGLGLDGLIALGLLIAAAHALCTYLRTRLSDRLGQRIVFDVRQDLFAHMQRLPLFFFSRQQTGAIASRLITDVAMAQNLVNVLATNVFMEFSVLVVVIAVIFSLEAKLALLACATLPFYVLVHKHFGALLRSGAREARSRMDLVEGDLHETITAISDVKSFTCESGREAHFEKRCRDHLAVLQRNVHAFGLSLASTTLLTRVPALLVLWVGARQVQQGLLSIGALMAFYAYLEMIYNPLTRLGDLNVQLANSRAAIDRIFELLDTPAESDEAAPRRPALIVRRGGVRFEGVVFGYRPGRRVLDCVDVEIDPGSKVALVGRSGVGKSTFAKLLLRFFTPDAGRILIDGQDISAVDLHSLRSAIAMVPQDPILFSGTVEDNLRLGKPEASESELWNALERAHAREFVLGLPEALRTPIGERGVTLSGGERQRLALARAFLKDAPILVLDEASAHLDPISEQLVRRATMELAEGRTTLIIAHRLTTVQTADRLLVFEDGRIVQDGAHRDLVQEEEGSYRRIFSDWLTGRPGEELLPLSTPGS